MRVTIATPLLNKLIEYNNELNTITAERIQIENSLHTLKEQLLFEQEYNRRCIEEFQCLENIQYDLNQQFGKSQFDKIIQEIR